MARYGFGCAIQKSDGKVTTLGVLDSEFHGESTRLGFNSGRHDPAKHGYENNYSENRVSLDRKFTFSEYEPRKVGLT